MYNDNRYDIPTAYKRLDTNVRSADNFVNTRNITRVNKNFNVLLAKRIPRVILNATFSEGVQDVVFYVQPCLSQPDINAGKAIISIPFMIDPYVTAISYKIRCYADDNAVKLYGIVHRFGNNQQVSDNEVITVAAGGSFWDLSSDIIPVGRGELVDATDMMYVFTLVARGNMTGTDSKAPAAVTDSGANWVTTANTSWSVGEAMYSPTDPSIEPREIVEIHSNVNPEGDDKTVVFPPWNKIPRSGTDTVAARICSEINVQAITIYEEYIDSFSNITYASLGA